MKIRYHRGDKLSKQPRKQSSTSRQTSEDWCRFPLLIGKINPQSQLNTDLEGGRAAFF
jgi:hypothetical protein